MKIGPRPAIHPPSPEIDAGGPAIHPPSPEIDAGAPNIHPPSPEIDAGGPNIHPPSPGIDAGGPAIHPPPVINTGGPAISGDGYSDSKATPNASVIGACELGPTSPAATPGPKLHELLIQAKAGGIATAGPKQPTIRPHDQLSPAKLEEWKTAFAAAKDSLHFEVNQQPPVGGPFTRVLLEKEPGFDNYSYYALLPHASADRPDPDLATAAWIVREGSFAGIPALAGPLDFGNGPIDAGPGPDFGNGPIDAGPGPDFGNGPIDGGAAPTLPGQQPSIRPHDQLSPARLEAWKTQFATAKDSLHFELNQQPPVGGPFTRVLLEKEPGFDNYSYYALLPHASADRPDPDLAAAAWIVREGGFAGIPALAGPLYLDD